MNMDELDNLFADIFAEKEPESAPEKEPEKEPEKVSCKCTFHNNSFFIF